MGMLDTLTNAVTGGLGSAIIDGIKAYFPPDLTPEQKQQFELAAQNIELQRTIVAQKAQADAEASLNERIAALEGTAADLKGVPIIGPILLLARGAQRPIWGYATIYVDFMVYSGAWKLNDDTLTSSFYIINVLVLGFLFGERAITNVMPLITNLMVARKGGNSNGNN